MMIDTWEILLRQVPALAIFAGLMYFMIKQFITYMMHRDNLLKAIGDQCTDAQNRSIDALGENTRVMGEVTEALRGINGANRRTENG
jgi:hypothetical protein